MKRCLLFCQLALFSTSAAQAQFTAGSEGFYITDGTDVYMNGLTLRPSEPISITDRTQNISSSPVDGSPPSIARVYQFDGPLSNFTGRLGFFYNDSELNANTESALKLTFGDPTYTSATNTVIDQNANYMYAEFTTPINFDRVTAATENALPVTLVDFTAKKEGGIAQLVWKTTAETNSSYFEVQRSTDAKVWSILGKVSAAGDSRALRDYAFADNSPVDGSNLYRLKLVDRDGSYAYSTIKNLLMDVAVATSVYPNPTSDKLVVSLDDWNNVKHVKLIDGSGRMLVNASDKNSGSEIDLKSYPSGIYLLQVVRTDGNTQTVKVVKR